MIKPHRKYGFLVLITILSFWHYAVYSQSRTFSSGGTFTVPPGVTSIIVECWGGGGAGGGSSANNSRGGGGGAGGAYARSTLSVTPGTNYTVTVGGVAAGTQSAGTTGNPSWFGTAATVYAQGGAGGAAPNGGTAAGGTGSAALSIGDVVYAGGNGASGTTTLSGGGGGGAGSGGAGGNASGTTRGTGTALNGGNGATGLTAEGDGSAGSSYGGGGSGAYIPDNTDHNGGDGAQGLVIVSWSVPVQLFTASGTYTVPAGVTSIVVETWGGGGGGSTRTSNGTFTGGGGGGGAYASSIIDVIPGNTYNYTVGSGGAASSAGGNSTFNTNSVIAAGGSGGTSNSSAAGAGGSAASSTGNIKYSGGNGANGGTSSGGGGGGAGISGNGSNASGATGGSGAPELGGTGANGVSGSSIGQNGSAFGGGGSGASVNSITDRTGGSGAAGAVAITRPYFSFGNDDPADLTSWWSNTNGTGSNPSSFTANNQIFIIQNGSTYTTQSAWSVSGKNTMVKIENGGILQADHSVSLSSDSYFYLTSGGTFRHNNNAGNNIFSGTNIISSGSYINYMYGGNQNIAPLTYSNLTLSGSGVKTFAATTINGTLSIEGTATTAGTAPSYGASSALRYRGTAAQTTGIEFPSTFSGTGGLTVDNASGLLLDADRTVSGSITMTQGNINTSSWVLTLSNSLFSSLSYTSGIITGKFRRAVSTALLNDYLFPVGSAGSYRPAVFNFTSISAGTDITAEFIATAPDGFTPYSDGSSNLDNLFTEGYWRFFSSSSPAVAYNLTLTGEDFTSYTIDDYTRISARDNSNATWRGSGLHGSRTGNSVTRSGATLISTTSFDYAFARGCSAVSMGYNYERTITIDFTKVSGGSNLFSFPVMIRLTGQSFLQTSPAGQIVNSNGYDIIFTDNAYNKLDHQLEYYSGTSGDLIAWVRIPVLSASSNTAIKILYGNPSVTTDPSVTSVWDSHYRGVWHLNNSTLNDFTSYAKNGTGYNSPTFTTGVISNSVNLNGTSQYLQVNSAPNINITGNMTISAWVYMDTGGRDQKIAGNQNNSSGGYKFGIFTNDKVEFEIRNSSNAASLNRAVAGGTVLSTGQWYYLAGISSDVLDSIKTFVNGIPERPFKKTGTLGTASDNLVIGREPFTGLYYFDGRFDELRISDKVRSNGWMRTEYNNQSSPSTFYSVSSEAVAYNLLSASICDGPITLTFGYPAGGTYSGNPYISGDVFTPPSAGTYSITYSYTSACGTSGITRDFIITPQPSAPSASSQVYCTGQIANLIATTGTNIKWYDSGGTLVSTANPYSTGITAAGTYNFTVTQTVNGCESPATAVTLTILAGATINTQPQPQTICDGDNATFSVGVLGYNLSYQWQENLVNLTEGGIYSGVNSPSLTLLNPGSAKNGASYRCIITTTCGTSPVNSGAASLTVTVPPAGTFSYAGSPYCPNAANALPSFSGGGIAGTFTSTAGLVFADPLTGEIDIASSAPGTYTVTNTIAAAGGCGPVVENSPLTITDNISWTGTSDSDWNNISNWTCNLVPSAGLDVTIPDVVNDPVLGAGLAAYVNDLTIEAGSVFTVASNSVYISGALSVSGTFDATGGTIVMNGSSAQTIAASVFASNTIKSLVVDNASGVTLSGPLGVTESVNISSGSLASDGNLTIISTSAGTGYIDGSGSGSITGDVTMQRYLPAAFGYKYFSSPFQDATVAEFSDDINLASAFTTLYRYDENRLVGGVPASGWVSYKTVTNPLVPLAGYAVNFGSVSVPATFDVTGTVNNGDMSVTLYNNDQIYTKGFNLVGNPYPSAIRWDLAGWTKTNIDDAIYYFRASGTDQYGGTYSSYVNGVPSDGFASPVIASMQGFFVHVTDGAYPVTGTLVVTNSVRIGDMTRPYLKSGSKGPSQLIRLAAGFSDDANSHDPVVVYFGNDATEGFDSKYDALKIFNTDLKVPNLYTPAEGGKRLSVNMLPEMTTSSLQIPLGLKINRAGMIKFSVMDIDGTTSALGVSLYDSATGVSHNLLNGNFYEVTLSQAEYMNRFYLNIGSVATGIRQPGNGGLSFSIYAASGPVITQVSGISGSRASLVIYNLLGQPVFRKELYDDGRYELTPELPEGVYIAMLMSGNSRISRKFYITGK